MVLGGIQKVPFSTFKQYTTNLHSRSTSSWRTIQPNHISVKVLDLDAFTPAGVYASMCMCVCLKYSEEDENFLPKSWNKTMNNFNLETLNTIRRNIRYGTGGIEAFGWSAIIVSASTVPITITQKMRHLYIIIFGAFHEPNAIDESDMPYVVSPTKCINYTYLVELSYPMQWGNFAHILSTSENISGKSLRSFMILWWRKKVEEVKIKILTFISFGLFGVFSVDFALVRAWFVACACLSIDMVAIVFFIVLIAYSSHPRHNSSLWYFVLLTILQLAVFHQCSTSAPHQCFSTKTLRLAFSSFLWWKFIMILPHCKKKTWRSDQLLYCWMGYACVRMKRNKFSTNPEKHSIFVI